MGTKLHPTENISEGPPLVRAGSSVQFTPAAPAFRGFRRAPGRLALRDCARLREPLRNRVYSGVEWAGKNVLPYGGRAGHRMRRR